jgi:hypothetical protein
MGTAPLRQLISFPHEHRLGFEGQYARVFKAPGCYVCGMCQKRHLRLQDAWDCVTADASTLQSLPNYAAPRGGAFTICLLCSCHYANEADAAVCMSRDLEISTLPKILKRALSLLATEALKGSSVSRRAPLTARPTSFGVSSWDVRRMPPKAVSLSPVGEKAKAPEEIVQRSLPSPSDMREAEFISFGEPDQGEVLTEQETLSTVPGAQEDLSVVPGAQKDLSVAPASGKVESGTLVESATLPVSPQEEDASPEKGGLTRMPNQTPFTRDDAKYVCTVCMAKFFTKSEVETHFLEHPLVESI